VTLRDELTRAAVAEAFELRGEPGEPFLDHEAEARWHGAVERVVFVHRVAPLIEYAAELDQAVDAIAVIEAAVAERTRWLEDELLAARRRAVLAEARESVLLAEVGRG
jgi:hypothetical protein